MVSLHDIAPRLARARDQFLADRAEQSRLDVLIASKRVALERLVAHRELQLVRAYATSDPRYISRRQRMLTSAQQRLAGFERSVAGERRVA